MSLKSFHCPNGLLFSTSIRSHSNTNRVRSHLYRIQIHAHINCKFLCSFQFGNNMMAGMACGESSVPPLCLTKSRNTNTMHSITVQPYIHIHTKIYMLFIVQICLRPDHHYLDTSKSQIKARVSPINVCFICRAFSQVGTN